MKGRPPLVALLVAASLSLATLDRFGPAGPAVAAARGAFRGGLAPAEAAGEAALRPVGDLLGALGRGGVLGRENARLRRALARSRSEAAQAEALARENARLAGLLGLPSVDGSPPVAARVVSLPAGRPGSTLVLDRGQEAGIRPGMPVVAAGALVGRVVEASRRRAAVLPLADPGSAVGVRLSGSGEVGVAQGLGAGRALRVDLLDPPTEVHLGELVLSSGLRHGRFPPGLPVGRVAEAGREGTVRLQPLVEPARLEVVEVLRWRPPA